MGREIKRVPLDFDQEINKVWGGYLMPDTLDLPECPACNGDGYSPRARHLQALWYGNVLFRPEDNGSVPFQPDHPVIHARAERNVTDTPWAYEAFVPSRRPDAIRREARRLADHFNSGWDHHLNADDVAALLAEGRLRDLTHTFNPVNRWQPKDPPVVPTPAEVNEWSLSGLGHDSINCWIVVRARCKREGVPYECETCGGSGDCATEEQRAAHEAWERTDPPEGEGWQLWETVSEGAPISPVFPDAEGLVEWMTTPAAKWGAMGPWSRKTAEAFVRGSGWAPTFVSSKEAGMMDGVTAVAAWT